MSRPSLLDHFLDLHRFRSGQVLMLCGPPFEGHGGFPAEGGVFAARVAEAVDVSEEGDCGVPAGLPVAAPDEFSLQG